LLTAPQWWQVTASAAWKIVGWIGPPHCVQRWGCWVSATASG
jgi:hypothetical protein